ncbi:hypothetical protein L208DRAFT_1374280 [Tricholoma matsutake]|nr:hypothetical protein L208DRAFT_1374280 [Tricholoma matsutake 945]
MSVELEGAWDKLISRKKPVNSMRLSESLSCGKKAPDMNNAKKIGVRVLEWITVTECKRSSMNTVGVDNSEWKGSLQIWAVGTIVTKLKNMSKVGDVIANEKSLFKVPHFGPVRWQHLMELNKAFSRCWHVLHAFVAYLRILVSDLEKLKFSFLSSLVFPCHPQKEKKFVSKENNKKRDMESDPLLPLNGPWDLKNVVIALSLHYWWPPKWTMESSPGHLDLGGPDQAESNDVPQIFPHIGNLADRT